MSRSPRKAIVQALTKVWSTRRFIADRDLAGWLRLRNAPPRTFSMVVAIYKVEDYLDDFVRSVLRQRGGLKQLEVIFVNDGSPDRSGEIAKAWAARHPDVFRYIEQENQGVAAARNAGLRIATGDWVGFPDPDDFFSRNYLLEARIAAMRGGEDLLAIKPNLILFQEASHRFQDRHRLRYRFTKGRRSISTDDMGDYIQVSASHFWMRSNILRELGIVFDSKVLPTGEDLHFVNRFYALAPRGRISIIPAAIYYYRKRSSEGSAVNTARDKITWYDDELRFGLLDLLATAKKAHGRVPVFIQRTVLYIIMWRFKHLLNHAERAAFLSDQQKTVFKGLVQEVLNDVDPDTIDEFKLADCTEEHKVALLSHYKSITRDPQRVYLKGLDRIKSLIQFAYVETPGHCRTITVRVNGVEVEKLFPSCRNTDFLGEVYFREQRFWIRADGSDTIEIDTAGSKETEVIGRGGKFSGPFTFDALHARQKSPTGLRVIVRRIKSKLAKVARNIVIRNVSLIGDVRKRVRISALRRYAQSSAARGLYGGCWLVMDGVDRADDNAEHFYRYLMKTGNAGRAYFVLGADSPDWSRLSSEGFHLLQFRSREHIAALINASFLISSHADPFILWPEARRNIGDITDYRFIFLQHGVIDKDLSTWLNQKPISLFITSTPMEYESIAASDSPYVFSKKEVALTGLARHDRLLAYATKPEIVLISPTWRRSLISTIAEGEHKRDKVNEFSASQYARCWANILRDPRLENAANRNGCQIVFCPHPNMMVYVRDFGLPAHVKVVEPSKEGGYQPLFAKTATLVTDYSSVASEVALLGRPVVYYQFDEDEIFSGQHTYTKGPFDWRRDGFGPVTTAHDATVDAIIAAISGDEDPVYAERRMQAFPHRDGRCCERIHQAILALDDPAVDALPSRPNAPTQPDRENALPAVG